MFRLLSRTDSSDYIIGDSGYYFRDFLMGRLTISKDKERGARKKGAVPEAGFKIPEKKAGSPSKIGPWMRSWPTL
jgi:hypothetical protein